jgi:hypothetical protein
MTLVLALWLLAASDAGAQVRVPCHTVADCWLDRDGQAVPRPKKFKGAPLPIGDCESKLTWLRTKLTCEANQCVATVVGDKC